MLDARRKRYIVLGCAAGAAALVVHRSGAVGRTKAWAARTAGLLKVYSDLLYTGGDMANTVLADLKVFLVSEGADEVPVSLQQLAKLLKSEEASSCCRALVSSTLQGAAEASQKLINHHESSDSPKLTNLADKFLALLFSKKGQSLVSVAVGIAAKNSVQTMCDFMENQSQRAGGGGGGNSSSEEMVAVGSQAILQIITHPEGQKALSAFIATFMASGIGTYIEKTSDHNYYEDMVASVATPSNRDAVEKISAHVTREAISAYMSYSVGSSHNTVPVSTGGSDPPSVHREHAEVSEVSRALSYGKATPGNTTAKKSRPKIILPSNPPGSVRKHETPVPAQVMVCNSQSMVMQIFQAASTADARKLIAEVAGSVTAEAVRATFVSLAQLVGWEPSSQPIGAKKSVSSLLLDRSGWTRLQTCYVVCLIFIGALLVYMCFSYMRLVPAVEGMVV